MSLNVLRLAGRAVAYLAFLAVTLAALVLVVVPLVTGSQTYTVLTSSMAPKYAPGTFLVVKPTPFEELRTGDIITYQATSNSPVVVTHRITSVIASQQGQRLLVTKGDNNSVEDELPVQEAQVRGKLFYAVPGVGFLANALGQGDRGLVLKLTAIALIGYGAFSIVKGGRQRKVKKEAADLQTPARDTSAGDAEVPSDAPEPHPTMDALAGNPPAETSAGPTEFPTRRSLRQPSTS
jgi:signal peptidase I